MKMLRFIIFLSVWTSCISAMRSPEKVIETRLREISQRLIDVDFLVRASNAHLNVIDAELAQLNQEQVKERETLQKEKALLEAQCAEFKNRTYA